MHQKRALPMPIVNQAKNRLKPGRRNRSAQKSGSSETFIKPENGRLQSALYKISEAAHSARSLNDLYGTIHAIIKGLMPAENFYIALLDDGTSMLYFPYFIDTEEDNPGPQKLGPGLTEYVLRTGQPLLASPEVFNELKEQGHVESVGPPSIDWLGVPLKTQDRTFGVLTVQSYIEGIRYNEEDKSILTFISEQTAMAIERKRALDALRTSEEKHRTIVENSLQGIVIIQDFRIIYANSAFSQISGYPLRELFALKPEKLKNIIHPEDQPMVWGRMMDRLAGKKVPSRYELRGIRKDGSICWLEMIASLVEHEGKPAVQSVLVDITDNKLADEERQQSFEKLRTTLEGTVKALASAFEMRDPYTAGHQQRVTELACTISKALNLPQDKVEGLRLAGEIHDIGKIQIPSEILSKPGRLTEIEFNMIKLHPQAGYEILKAVAFPYPVAQIILQHHERMDGSGYPKGLKGSKILKEARILAVADVVEAMASHRPYRPPLGIHRALEEIEKNKGILYDRKAADACLHLFKQESFRLPSGETDAEDGVHPDARG